MTRGQVNLGTFKVIATVEVDEVAGTVSIRYGADFEARPIADQVEILRAAAAVAQTDLAAASNEERHDCAEEGA